MNECAVQWIVYVVLQGRGPSRARARVETQGALVPLQAHESTSPICSIHARAADTVAVVGFGGKLIRGAVVVGGVAMLLGTPSALAQAAEEFTLVGGESARTVQLSPCLIAPPTPNDGLSTSACLRGQADSLSGVLTVAIVNNGDARAELTMRYIQDGSTAPVAVLTGHGPVTLLGASSATLAARARSFAQSRPSTAQLLALLSGAPQRTAPQTLVNVVDEARSGRLSKRHVGRAVSLLKAVGRFLSPPGADLAVRPADLTLVLDDVHAIATAPTPHAPLKQISKLIADVRLIIARATIKIEKRQKKVVTVRIDTTRTGDPNGLGGVLELDLSEPATSEPRATEPAQPAFNVPVEVKIGSLSGITFEPSTVHLQATSPGRGATAGVVLRGPGVSTLFASQSPDGVTIPEVNVPLGGRTDNDTQVSLTQVKKVTDEEATATVSVPDGPPPGSYTVALPVSRTVTDPPTLTVEVRSNIARWIAFLLITVGLIVGGLLPRWYSLHRRRQLLLDALDDAIGNYALHYDPDDEPASWELNDLIRPARNEHQEVKRDSDNKVNWQGGVADLRADVDSARNDADLDDDTTRVLDVTARVQRWLRIEPAARRLEGLAQQTDDVGGLDWPASQTYLDTLAVLRAAKHEPTSSAAADELAAKILWQTDWYHRFRTLCTVPGATPQEDIAALERALGETAALERTPAQRDALSARLDAAMHRRDAPTLTTVSVPERTTLDPAEKWITPRFDVAAVHFTGWATLDGMAYQRLAARSTQRRLVVPPYQRLADAAPTPARAITKDQLTEPATKPKKSPIWGDIIWSALLLAGAALAYMLTVYSSTWGSLDDLLTALAAGFGTAVVVQWAALPLFQSVRLRGASSTGSPSGDGS